MVIEEPSGLSSNHSSLQIRQVGVTKIAAAVVLSTAFRQRFERCKKYFCPGCRNLKKS
jgi:hypothetical protein